MLENSKVIDENGNKISQNIIGLENNTIPVSGMMIGREHIFT